MNLTYNIGCKNTWLSARGKLCHWNKGYFDSDCPALDNHNRRNISHVNEWRRSSGNRFYCCFGKHDDRKISTAPSPVWTAWVRSWTGLSRMETDKVRDWRNNGKWEESHHWINCGNTWVVVDSVQSQAQKALWNQTDRLATILIIANQDGGLQVYSILALEGTSSIAAEVYGLTSTSLMNIFSMDI